MNISSEVVLGIVAALGTGLTAAVGKMWLAFTGELKDCKEDRKELHGKVESLHSRIIEVSMAVGRLEGSQPRKPEL